MYSLKFSQCISRGLKQTLILGECILLYECTHCNLTLCLAFYGPAGWVGNPGLPRQVKGAVVNMPPTNSMNTYTEAKQQAFSLLNCLSVLQQPPGLFCFCFFVGGRGGEGLSMSMCCTIYSLKLEFGLINLGLADLHQVGLIRSLQTWRHQATCP